MKLESMVSFKQCMILILFFPTLQTWGLIGRFIYVQKGVGMTNNVNFARMRLSDFTSAVKRQLIVNICSKCNCKSKQFPTKILIISWQNVNAPRTVIIFYHQGRSWSRLKNRLFLDVRLDFRIISLWFVKGRGLIYYF